LLFKARHNHESQWGPMLFYGQTHLKRFRISSFVFLRGEKSNTGSKWQRWGEKKGVLSL